MSELYDIETEKKLLASLMLKGGEAVGECPLKAADFFRPEHRIIYSTLRRLNANGVVIDVSVLKSELERRDVPIDSGYVLGLSELEYTTVRAGWYAKNLKELANLRRLVDVGRELADDAIGMRGTSAELAAKVEERLAKETPVEEAESLAEILKKTYENLQNHWANGGALGLSTGMQTLNKLTGGFRKSDLIILAARPSMGKTALALNFATFAARRHRVLLFSLEMSKMQLAERQLASKSRIPATKIREGNLNKKELSRLTGAMEELSDYNLEVDDTRTVNLFELKRRARRAKRLGLDLIVIDYLQLIVGSKEYRGNRVQEISEISRGLKGIAGELEVPVLALSQLSRSVESRMDKRPLLSDLRESGSIEQDADIVMFLYREEYYNRNADAEEAEIIVAKNRNGATGHVNLLFDKECQIFRERMKEV